ncbi:MAG: hypothetical protein K2M44_00165 [Clostridia bacterium]|nr:hypothetical protein [Clostridia bacterium]
MEFSKLLEYQEIDRDVIKLENKLRSSEEAKKLQSYMDQYKKTQDNLIRINNGAQTGTDKIDKLNDKFNSLVSELEELDGAVEEVDELKETEFYEKRINELSEMLDALERDIAAAARELDVLSTQGNSELILLQKYQAAIKKVSDDYARVKADIQKEAGGKLAKLKTLEKDIDADIMAMYKRVRGNKKTPVLVPFRDNVLCGGCGMEMSVNEVGKINSAGLCECPNCGRIVYKAD